jgi:FtsH-binding integral membrane protein
MCTLFIVIYSIYIVIDVQLLVSGQRYGLTYDDHIVGSLYLYLDIVNLFWSCIELGKNSFD